MFFVLMKDECFKVKRSTKPHRGYVCFSSQTDGDKPIRNFLDDPRRSGPVADTDRKEGSRRHVRNWGGLDFDNVKTRAELEKEWTVSRFTGLSPAASSADLSPVLSP